MPYTTAQEIAYLHELFSRPPAIVEACNRVHAQFQGETERRVAEISNLHWEHLGRIDKWQKLAIGRAKGNAWWKGVFWGLGSVAAVFLLVMAVGWLAE